MRTITDHKLNGLNEAITVAVLDQPGAGGACHEYVMSFEGPEVALGLPCEPRTKQHIHFQNGPIAESGVNGVSQEALLAIVIDRLRSFQSGEYKCRENACALTHCEEALMWLQKRTRDRLARGVEGTSAK
jgi:hypothetical protein